MVATKMPKNTIFDLESLFAQKMCLQHR